MAHEADLAYLAKYPFLEEAKSYVASAGYRLGDLLEDHAFGRSRHRALARVMGAFGSDGLEDAALETPTQAEIELLSYPLARALVAEVGDKYLVNRYAVAEAKLLNKRLRAEEVATVKAVAAQLRIPFEETDGLATFARLHFIHYLRNAPTRMVSWKLVNRTLDGGFVSLTRQDAVRLCEEALRNRLAEEVVALERPGKAVVRAFGPAFNELRMKLAAHHARFKDEVQGDVRLEAFPPCMTQIWEGIKAHQNVPHQGRFAIVAFLHHLGMNSEAILDFFTAVPDFDPNKSRYQIQHITGEIGGSTEYTPPGCQTMATYGICPLEDRDALCFKITHPLSYYRRRYGELKRSGKLKKAPGGGNVKPPAAAAEASDG